MRKPAAALWGALHDDGLAGLVWQVRHGVVRRVDAQRARVKRWLGVAFRDVRTVTYDDRAEAVVINSSATALPGELNDLNVSLKETVAELDDYQESIDRPGVAARARLRFGRFPEDGSRDPDLFQVAVIVPTHSSHGHLEATLESLRQQTFTHWHCYIVDDAGDVDLSHLAGKDDRITVLRHAGNRGLAVARNTGILSSKEPVIQFLDDDDLLTPWALESRIRALHPYWYVDCVAGSAGRILQTADTFELGSLGGWSSSRAETGKVDFLDSMGENVFGVHAPVLKRRVLERVGGFKSEMKRGAEDWEFWDRVLRCGYAFVQIAGVVGAYRQRAAGMIHADNSGHVVAAQIMLARASHVVRLPDDTPSSGLSMPGPTQLATHKRALRGIMYALLRVGQGLDPSSKFDDLRPLFEGYPWPQTRSWERQATARNAFIRGLGLGREEFERLDLRDRERAYDLCDEALSNLQDQFCLGASDTIDETPALISRKVVDVLLCAATASDVVESIPLVRSLREAGYAIWGVTTEDYSGEQGAREEFLMREIPCFSVDDVLLGEVRSQHLIFAGEPGGSGWGLAAAGSAWGADVRRLSGGLGALPEVRDTSEWDAFPEVSPTSPLTFTQERLLEKPLSGYLIADELAKEEGPLDEDSSEVLRALKGCFDGQTCVIIGNGPSLNDTDLSLLADVPTFGVNRLYLAKDRLPGPLTFYVVEDSAVMLENAEEIAAVESQFTFLPTDYKDAFKGLDVDKSPVYFRMNAGFYGRGTSAYCLPRFSTRADQRLFCGQSVTYINMQLAYWMGFRKVILVGMDFSYEVPTDSLIKGNHILSQGPDPNHFHPDYFGAGRTWKDPKLERVKANYELARRMFASRDREIVNASVGGQLDVFRRQDLSIALRD